MNYKQLVRAIGKADSIYARATVTPIGEGYHFKISKQAAKQMARNVLFGADTQYNAVLNSEGELLIG